MTEYEEKRGKWRFDVETGSLVQVSFVPKVEVAAIHQDTMNPTWHPATGETYDSKSAFRRMTKEKGYVEIDDERTWQSFGRHQNRQIEGLREDLEEVKHWYAAAMNGNRDYINANVPPELRDCEEVNPDDITEGIR